MDSPCCGTFRSPLQRKCAGARLQGIAHRRRVLGPNYLIRACARQVRQLPILGRRPGHRRFHAHHRRARGALTEPPLYPRHPTARQRALALEDDPTNLGPARRGHRDAAVSEGSDVGLRVLMTACREGLHDVAAAAPGFPMVLPAPPQDQRANLEKDRAVVTAASPHRAERQGPGFSSARFHGC